MYQGGLTPQEIVAKNIRTERTGYKITFKETGSVLAKKAPGRQRLSSER